MTFLENLAVALFCISMVFLLLACVFVLIKLSSFIIRLFADRKKTNAAHSSDQPGKRNTSQANEEVFSSGALKLKNVDEGTAAMIIAIVSDESGVPLTELCFKSIQLIEPGKNKTIRAGGYVMIYVVRINDKEYEVEVEKGKANIIKTVEVSSAPKNNVTPIAAAHNVPSTPVVPMADISSEGAVVRAPMPGTVLEVKVTIGEKVQQGNVLLVLEAMKMENEILASGSGIIKQVLVTKGASVATDDVLIIIE